MNTTRYFAIYKCLIVSMFLLLQAQLFAQGNSANENRKEQLVGTWLLDFDKTISQIDSKAKEVYGKMNLVFKENLKKSFSKRKIIFKADGTYIIEIKPGIQQQGTWQLLDNEIDLLIVMDYGKRYNRRIESINSSKLILNLGEHKNQPSKALLQKWELKKINH